MKKFATILAMILLTTGLYGQYSNQKATTYQVNEALAYGLEAVEMNVVLRKLLANQKAQIIVLGLVNDEIKLQSDLLTQKVRLIEKNSFWQRFWATLKIIGAATIGFVIGTI